MYRSPVPYIGLKCHHSVEWLPVSWTNIKAQFPVNQTRLVTHWTIPGVSNMVTEIDCCDHFGVPLFFSSKQFLDPFFSSCNWICSTHIKHEICKHLFVIPWSDPKLYNIHVWWHQVLVKWDPEANCSNSNKINQWFLHGVRLSEKCCDSLYYMKINTLSGTMI